MIKPYVFLTFANDRNPEAQRFLTELDKEEQQINDQLDSCEWCEVRSRREATYDRILRVLGKQDYIRIFHFSGHAGPDNLLLADESEGNRKALVKGMAKTIRGSGIQLAFLNGCSTEDQVKAFHKAGIPAVISTRYPVTDRMAREFAVYFYTFLVEDYTIQQAFEKAEIAILSTIEEADRYRSLEWADHPIDPDHPYQLRIHPKHTQVADQTLKDWYKELDQIIKEYDHENDEEDNEMPEGFGDGEDTLGPDSYLKCNRRKETLLFEQQVEAVLKAKEAGKTHAPQLLLIHGPSEEVPESLVQRYVSYELEELYSSFQQRCKHKKVIRVDFPTQEELEGETLEDSLYLIESELQRAFGLRRKTLGTKELILQAGKHADVICIQHDILEGDPAMLIPLIRIYLQQYRQLELEASIPHVLVVFHITEPKSSLLKSISPFRKKSTNTWDPLSSEFPSLSVLPRLSPVSRTDVQRWQRRYLRDMPGLVDQLFGKKKELPMQRIQEKLSEIIRTRLTA